MAKSRQNSPEIWDWNTRAPCTMMYASMQDPCANEMEGKCLDG
jgi:hypothetical protein